MSENKEFARSLENATVKIIKDTIKNTEKATLFLKNKAVKECPIDQGILRAAMFNDVKVTGSEIIRRVGNTEEYAPYVHQGTGLYAINGDGRKTPWKFKVESGKYKGFHITKGQKPQPFLDNAKLRNKDKILNILAGR